MRAPPRGLPADGEVLFNSHHRAEQQHPTDAARAYDEHQEHQRPATAHAVDAVMCPNRKGLSLDVAAAPMSEYKAQWCPTPIQAPVLEVSELKNTGDAEHEHAQHPVPATRSGAPPR